MTCQCTLTRRALYASAWPLRVECVHLRSRAIAWFSLRCIGVASWPSDMARFSVQACATAWTIEHKAHVDTSDTTPQLSCISVLCGLANSVTQAQFGTDESPTCEITCCWGMSQFLASQLAKRVAYSHFVNAFRNLRQQRSSPESRQAIGAIATICSMAGGSWPREAIGPSWKEDTVRNA